MGIPSEIRDYWAQTIKNKKKQISINNNNNNNNNSLWICSPAEDQRILEARRCTQEGVKAGAKAAAVAAVASAIPTLVAVRVIPWAKANLNYTAQALIISAASISAYFITADKTILECARRNAQYDKTT
ncbi:early nodulin-93 isoform X2 [Ricinus communis]|uniref:Early nodulin, putative n=1 Tax=Ricinus communis TaxID=3988 RepID=B9SHI1_RICCO|nr:early nodulin-93 isoform X2 [Ricinus communis]EEF36940.1 Early nodulin, putative [Ricinus communis]|eukprot:XP_002525450.1 early nodulin-93 [Ricinus communis]